MWAERMQILGISYQAMIHLGIYLLMKKKKEEAQNVEQQMQKRPNYREDFSAFHFAQSLGSLKGQKKFGSLYFPELDRGPIMNF